jgi:hypothetical protein
MSTIAAKICFPECNDRDETSAVLGSKGACIAPTHLQHVPSKFLAFFCNKFLKLIDAFPPQTKIVAYIKTESKAFLCFHEDCGIFCEGVKDEQSKQKINYDKNDDTLIVDWQLVGCCIIGLNNLVNHNGLVDCTNPNGLIGCVGRCIIGLINLSDLTKHWLTRNGLVGFIGLVGHIGFIGGFVGFVSLGLVSLGGFISDISLTGFIGLSLVGFIGLGLVSWLISLIGLISLGLVGIISLVGSSASSACRIIGLVSRAILSAHCWPHNLVAAIIAAARKQAAHGVATMLTSATKIVNASFYYFASSSLHVCLFVREKMCWWLALARKKM